MKQIGPVSIVDEDFRRRAQLSFSLARRGIHTEPHENLSELLASEPSRGIILIHDEDDLIENLARLTRLQDVRLPVIAYSSDLNPARVVSAVRNGVADYLSWPLDAEAVVAAISGLQQIPQSTHYSMPLAIDDTNGTPLTRREREVLAAAAQGLPNKLIGKKLHISHRTVEVHRYRALKKIGAKNVSDAVRSMFGISFVA